MAARGGACVGCQEARRRCVGREGQPCERCAANGKICVRSANLRSFTRRRGKSGQTVGHAVANTFEIASSSALGSHGHTYQHGWRPAGPFACCSALNRNLGFGGVARLLRQWWRFVNREHRGELPPLMGSILQASFVSALAANSTQGVNTITHIASKLKVELPFGEPHIPHVPPNEINESSQRPEIAWNETFETSHDVRGFPGGPQSQPESRSTRLASGAKRLRAASGGTKFNDGAAGQKRNRMGWGGEGQKTRVLSDRGSEAKLVFPEDVHTSVVEAPQARGRFCQRSRDAEGVISDDGSGREQLSLGANFPKAPEPGSSGHGIGEDCEISSRAAQAPQCSADAAARKIPIIGPFIDTLRVDDLRRALVEMCATSSFFISVLGVDGQETRTPNENFRRLFLGSGGSLLEGPHREQVPESPSFPRVNSLRATHSLTDLSEFLNQAEIFTAPCMLNAWHGHLADPADGLSFMDRFFAQSTGSKDAENGSDAAAGENQCFVRESSANLSEAKLQSTMDSPFSESALDGSESQSLAQPATSMSDAASMYSIVELEPAVLARVDAFAGLRSSKPVMLRCTDGFCYSATVFYCMLVAHCGRVYAAAVAFENVQPLSWGAFSRLYREDNSTAQFVMHRTVLHESPGATV